MTIHREGYKTLALTLVILLLINIPVYLWTDSPLVLWPVGIISLLLFFIVLQFFRHPERVTPVSETHVISPADGKVVVIEEVEETEYFHDRRLQISIFMSPINVHVNRNPISGKVVLSKYHPGLYLVAWHPKSSTENERTTVVIRNPRAAVLFRQIAGALARRIVCYLKEGDVVKQGDEMGFIKFGSRVDVFLPVGSKVKVRLGEKVTGGVSVLALL